MSTVTDSSQSQASRNGASADEGLPEASLAESMRFVLTGLLPSLARGLFSPRPGPMKRLTALNTDQKAIDTLAAIRRKHGGQGARLLGGRIVTLWGRDAIREVLDQSADVYASDSGAKGKGMSHFQPNALTLSRGEEWRDRRAFNESVLATSEKVHPDGSCMLSVVQDEVARFRVGPSLEWADWEKLFDHITLRVIFGDRSRGDWELTELLGKLMRESNRLVGLSENDEYHEFYGRLGDKLSKPEPDSLLARFADAPQTARTKIAGQIPHMMFAMRDTLGANAFRALATIVALPGVEDRVRGEIEGKDLCDPATYEGLEYLEGCLQEAMRLWPTVPLLARETTRETTLAGTKIDEGTQVMILNAFNHRDPEIPDADRFVPERWKGGMRDYKFNHLSNGSQDCPGGAMVLLLGKAVLAHVLQDFEIELEEPELREPLPAMFDFFSARFKAQVHGAP